MHREDPLQRQPVVHHREDRLLDLPRIERAADEQLAPRRMQHHERPRPRPVQLRVGLEIRRVQNKRVRPEALQLILGQVDEHRLREQRVIRMRRHHPHPQTVLPVGARPRIHDIQRLGLAQLVGHLRAQPGEMRLRQRRVHLTPPDPILGSRLTHHELVLRRPARMHPGIDRQRTTLRQPPITPQQRMRIQQSRRRVAKHTPRGSQPHAPTNPAGPRLRRRHAAGWYSVRVRSAAEAGSDAASRRRAGRARARRAVMPVTSSSGEPIMKSTWVALWFERARSPSSSSTKA